MSSMEKNEDKNTIVQLGRKRIKTPGQKKQTLATVIILAVVLILTVTVYGLMNGREETYTLRDFESSPVTLSTFEQNIQAGGTVKIIRQLDLPNQTKGYVDELYVHEGDSISPLTVLAILDVPTLSEELEDYQLGLEEARLILTRLKTEHDFALRSLTRDIARLAADLESAEKEAAARKQLVKINASRQADLEAAEESRDTIKENLEDTRLALEKQETINRLEILSQEAAVRQLETRIYRTMSEMEKAKIKSPISGEVLYINTALSVPGGQIPQDTMLFTIADRSSAVVELEVYEQYAALLAPGQELILTVGGDKIKGTIQSIGQFAETSSDGLGASVTVTVKPDQSGGYLTPGATVVTELSLGTRENVMLLPRGAWLTTGSQKYAYVVRGGTAVKTNITLGDIGDSLVEILSGIKPDEEVIISGYQNFIEYNVLYIKEEESHD